MEKSGDKNKAGKIIREYKKGKLEINKKKNDYEDTERKENPSKDRFSDLNVSNPQIYFVKMMRKMHFF